MTTRTKSLLLAVAVLVGGVLCWRATSGISTPRVRVVSSLASARELPRIAGEAPASPIQVVGAGSKSSFVATRREAVEYVAALYRKEQLARELDLEQRRYGRNYWQSESGGRELAKLQQAKEEMLKELSVEANQVLKDLFPGEPGEPLTLAVIFDAEHAGPNLTFLSPALREQFEAEILANEGNGGVERERLLEIAARVLPPGELDLYRKWNELPTAALRAQLVGFNPTESEFVAILRDTRLSEEDREGPGVIAGLEAQLGAVRHAELLQLQNPAMHTALQDLQRLGLPLGEAGWLATARTQAISEIQEIWQNSALTDAMKRERVAQLERDHGKAIAAKLALPEGALDGITPSS